MGVEHNQPSRGFDERTLMLIALCFNAYDCCGLPKCRYISQTSDQASFFLSPFPTEHC